MLGPACKHVNDVAAQLGAARLLGPGIIDYALGAEPYSGAFVVVHEEDPERRRELAYFKMGEGPFYVFYTPFHLPHIQVASTIARAALQHDATVAPVGSMVCEVITVAKRGLKAGEVLDGVGGFLAYGLIDNVPVCRSADLLPMGLSGGATLVHDVTQDQPITFADVQLPSGRLSMDLWLEQQQYFAR
jgi:predicted homoserine dehydrogenase-like protein